MKTITLLLLLFVCYTSTGQKTIPKVSKGSDKHASYFVLKKKPYIKHGEYKMYRNSDTMLLEEGSFDMGEEVGIWTYYGWEGEVYKKYDFTEKKIIFYNSEADSVTTIIRTNGELKRVKLEWPLEYVGGMNEISLHIMKNIVYPERAREDGISGKVLISFFISTAGIAIEHTIIQSAGELLDEEAMRVIKLIQDRWLPGKYEGVPVEIRVVIPVNFTIA